jgi:predicted permease
MPDVKELWRRLLWLARRSRFHNELADEMQFHIECRAAELQHGGMPHDEALACARREFGSPMRAAEDTQSAWQLRWIEDLFSDLRYAARAFQRSPGFALTAVVCLALGLGANTTIFSLTTNFLLSQPSCRDVGSLIAIQGGGNSASRVSDYRFVRDAHIFSGMAGMNPEREVNWRDGDRTSRLYAATVTEDYFSTLGVPFQLGRGIGPGETNTVVLSQRLWRQRFAGDPGILGRAVVIDGRVCTVVGVLPADNRNIMGFGFSPDIYVPVTGDDDWVQFYARMPEGMTIGVARARLQSVLAELDRIHPIDGWKRTQGTRVAGVGGLAALNMLMPGAVTAFFGMLMGVTLLVLTIACANVASLLLARASSREHEIAVRLSLGASRARVVRHLLAESLLLAALGALGGLAIDLVCARLVMNLDLPVPAPIHLIVAPDWRLLAYASVLAALTALLAGLMPALKAVRRNVNPMLKTSERQTAPIWGLRSILVAGQLAVSIVLLAAGFLFLQNLLRATSMNPGFDVRHTAWAYMRLVPENYKDRARQMALVNQALERLRALPGVETAAITRNVPLNGNCRVYTNLRKDLSARDMAVDYECNDVGPDYFRTVGIPLVRGREFTAADRPGSQPVGIVNESFARTVFGNTDPVGHTITIDRGTWLIVGVVKDSKYFLLSEQQRMALYTPYLAGDEPVNLNFVVRIAGSPLDSLRAMNKALGGLDPSAAVETKAMNQSLGLALLPSRVGAVLLGIMGALGLALASIGLYGVLQYSVSRRTREIGLRVALGATPAAVLRLVCGHTCILAGSGIVAGLALAWLALRPLAFFLVPGLNASNPATFLAVTGVLSLVAMLATLVPAARALRVCPMIALRYE